MKSWILVADSRRARVFATDGRKSELTEIADFAHSSGALQGENPRGHIFAGQSGTRHGLEPTASPKKKQQHSFATQLAQYLEHEFSQRHFADLTLVAPPEFLGELRAALPSGLEAVVGSEIAKDLIACSSKELSGYLNAQSLR